MNKKVLVTSIAAVVLAGVALYPQVADAYRGDPNVKGPNYSAERHEAMTKAFETNNYNAWKAQMNGRGRVTQIINEKNFARFAEAHRLALQGKTAEANKIRAELGLNNGQGMKNGQGGGYGRNR